MISVDRWLRWLCINLVLVNCNKVHYSGIFSVTGKLMELDHKIVVFLQLQHIGLGCLWNFGFQLTYLRNTCMALSKVGPFCLHAPMSNSHRNERGPASHAVSMAAARKIFSVDWHFSNSRYQIALWAGHCSWTRSGDCSQSNGRIRATF